MPELTWVDVLAGNIAAAFWIVAVLSARRSWMEQKSFIHGATLVFWLGIGAGLVLYKMAFWAHELSSGAQLARALQ